MKTTECTAYYLKTEGSTALAGITKPLWNQKKFK